MRAEEVTEIFEGMQLDDIAAEVERRLDPRTKNAAPRAAIRL
jgi:hypothetical protein